MTKTRITVVGMGPTGLLDALHLARQHEVTGLDTDPTTIKSLRQGIAPNNHSEAARELAAVQLKLVFTTNARVALKDADYVVVATPTSFDPATDSYDTSSVDATIAEAQLATPQAKILIRSDVPTDYVSRLTTRPGSFPPILVPSDESATPLTLERTP